MSSALLLNLAPSSIALPPSPKAVRVGVAVDVHGRAPTSSNLNLTGEIVQRRALDGVLDGGRHRFEQAAHDDARRRSWLLLQRARVVQTPGRRRADAARRRAVGVEHGALQTALWPASSSSSSAKSEAVHDDDERMTCVGSTHRHKCSDTVAPRRVEIAI